METQQQDPRLKSQVKDEFMLSLYSTPIIHFGNRIDEIATRNCVIGSFRHKSFAYKGIFYNREGTPAPLRRNRLQPALHATMDEWLADRHSIWNVEQPAINGYILLVLNTSNKPGDYLKMLPESVHESIAKCFSPHLLLETTIDDAKAAEIIKQYQHCFDLIKKRQVLNLLL